MSAERKSEDEKVEKLFDLIKDTHIAMLTTVADDGSLRSRPMGYIAPDEAFDGTLYFFTRADSGKVEEIQREEQVNVSFTEPKEQHYVSLSGTARLSFDREKMKSLWSPYLKIWFPDGIEDPDLALLVITVEQAEYWDSPSGAVVLLYGRVKSALTGTPPSIGENEKIDMDRITTAANTPAAVTGA